MEETTATNRQRLSTSTGTLTSPSLSSSSPDTPGTPPLISLPSDLVEEILCRLPVKFLLQLRCVCKFWNSLISDDPKFATKHLRMSTTRHHLVLSFPISSRDINVISYPLHYVFNTMATNVAQLEYPAPNNQNYFSRLVGSCDSVLCFAMDQRLALLWNTCIRKFKKLPSLENPQDGKTIYGFGYDPFTSNYKVVSVFCYDYERDISGIEICKTQANVYTLGTDSWRRIQEFLLGVPIDESGKFVSGTVNWLASTNLTDFSCWCSIVSLDLQKESYQQILQPNYGGGVNMVCLSLGVLKDCLCIFSHSNSFNDVWIMKEYGNKESWTKLFSFPYIEDIGIHYYTKGVYIYEEDQILLEMEYSTFMTKMVVYDSKNGTFNDPEIQHFIGWIAPEVYVESLISPCF